MAAKDVRPDRKREDKSRYATWNTALAKEMYDRGDSYTAIGKAVGQNKGTVAGYAARHWPKQDFRAERDCNNFTARRKFGTQLPLPIGSKSTLPPLASLTFDN